MNSSSTVLGAGVSRQKIAAKQRARTEQQNSLSTDEIYQKVYVAVLEYRLRPGTKLAESRLAAIFGCSRTRVREALARLANEMVVEQISQRGAFIAQPSVEQARDVFELRRIMEPAILKRLIETLTAEKIAILRAHQQLEIQARALGDNPKVIRLAGDFHRLLAELAGNSVMASNMRQLTVLTCLAICLYNAPVPTSCRADEHGQMIDAIESRDLEGAQLLMANHLDHIEESLRLDTDLAEPDLEAIFRM